MSIVCMLMITCGDSRNLSSEGPIEPENALSTFQLEPGFKIELISSEPVVSDPVDMEIDEYGRLYVVEMHGYPLDTSGAGQIKLLRDNDGDGKFEESIVFADSLILPFGIMRYKKGLLVADAPDVIYLEDTTGDGRADVRDIMLTGFAFTNAQMNAGNPLYGLDNWIYLTSEAGGTYQIYKDQFSFVGDDIVFAGLPATPRIPLEGTGRTVRFRPDRHQLELTSGITQFGHSFDRWGNHILGNNSNHIYHEVIAAPYLKRNPDLLVADATETLTDHGSNVFPVTENPERQLLTNVGIFTSACGNTLYTGGDFGTPYNNAVHFVAEPVSNLVHADYLKNHGVSFTASRIGADPRREFLASTDAWFRPVNMCVGPDGALYLLDYYREIIEHPEWMSKEAINAGRLYNGRDRGRIYRISRVDAKPASWTKGIDLGDATDEELVEQLANPNSWWRLNAQRLLVDRRSAQAPPLLAEMVRTSTCEMGRLHALWTLEGLEKLTPDLIQLALRDSVAGIRQNAIKLLEPHLSADPTLENLLLPLKDDPDPKVRFQLLCTLGSINSPESAEAREHLLFMDLDDKWVQIAALSASSTQAGSLLKEVLGDFKEGVPAYASMIERLTDLVGASGTPRDIADLIHQATQTALQEGGWQVPVLAGLAGGLEKRKKAPAVFRDEQTLLIKTFFEHPSPAMRNASLQILKVAQIKDKREAESAMEKAASIAKDANLPDERRVEAIRFLALDNPAEHASLLKGLIVPQEKHAVQVAALNTMSRIPDQTVSNFVLERWMALTPEIRHTAINTFLSSKDRILLLLDALDSGKIQKASIHFYQAVELMTQPDEKVRVRARSMFAHNDEANVNKNYKEALKLKGNEGKGEIIYQKYCALCHQMRGTMGVAFGPDLATVRNWQPQSIMAHILAPNLSIAAGYELWAVELNNGEFVQGIIASETPAAIKLKNTGGIETIINRQDIKSLKTLNISAMPPGLEANISERDMADLLAFLRKNK